MSNSPKLKVLIGRAQPKLAKEIADRLKTGLVKVNLSDFANGEVNIQLNESLAGSTVIVIQPHAGELNKQIVEQALLIRAAQQAGAVTIIAVCPYLGYSRQHDLKSQQQPAGAQLVLDILATAGANSILALDLHSDEIESSKLRLKNIETAKFLSAKVKPWLPKDLVVVAPDRGRLKTAHRYARLLKCELAVIDKYRAGNRVSSKLQSGDVAGRDCLIVEDIIDSGATLLSTAELLKKHGAKKLYAVATHGIFTEPVAKLKKAGFQKIIVTDSLPQPAGVEVLSIAQLLADSIKNEVFG